MKTQSIKSIATLLGVAVVLNVSALAGPGPHEQFQTRKISEPKKVAATIGLAVKAPAAGKSVVESRPTLTQAPGPHGVIYAYRGVNAYTW